MENEIAAAEIKFSVGFLEALGISSGENFAEPQALEEVLRALDPLAQKSVMFTFGLCNSKLIPLLDLEEEAKRTGETIWDAKERGMSQIRKNLGLPEIQDDRKKRRGRTSLREKETDRLISIQSDPRHSLADLAEGLTRLFSEMERLWRIFSGSGKKIPEQAAAPPEEKEEAPICAPLPELEIAYSGRSDAARLLRSPAFREDLGISISFERLGELLKDPGLEKYWKEVLIATYCTKGCDRLSPYRIVKQRGGSPKTIQKWIGQAIDFIRQNA